MERGSLSLARRVLGPPPAEFRVGARSLSMDARRICVRNRLLGRGRRPAWRALRAGLRQLWRRGRDLRLHAGLRGARYGRR